MRPSRDAEDKGCLLEYGQNDCIVLAYRKEGSQKGADIEWKSKEEW